MFRSVFRLITRGLGLEPKMPAVAPPPPLPAMQAMPSTVPDASTSAAAAEEERRRLAMSRGRAANLLTGALGVPDEAVARPTAGGRLLGG